MAAALASTRAFRLLAFSAVVLFGAASAYGQACFAQPPPPPSFAAWTGGSGNWSNCNNWTTVPYVPNSASTTVAIINGTANAPVITSTVGIDPAVNNLTIGTYNTLQITTNTNVTVYGSSIMNLGAIDLTSAGQATQLLLNSSATLNGGGTVTLAGSSAAQIFGTGVTLENVDNLIQGQGSIGVGGTMVFQNDVKGLVNANVIGQTMTLSLAGTAAAPGLINYGTLEATNSGTLTISNTIVNNGPDVVGGLITTDSNPKSVVVLSGATTIQGGTLNGNIQINSFGSFAPTLDGLTHGALTNLGTITAPNDTGFNILPGSYINNVGSITLAGAGSLTGINLGSAPSNTLLTTTFAGGGTLTLTGGGATSISGGTGLILENLDQTIEGNGTISGAMTLRNDVNGLVNANVSGLGLLLQNTGGVINIGTGKLEATNGGLLQINTTVNNSGATITTDNGNGSAVQLESLAKIQGGTLSGNVETLGNPTLDGTTHGILTNAGSFTVQAANTATLTPGSIINNTGTINVASNGSGTFLYLGSSPLTTQLSGGGTVTLSSPAGTTTAAIYGDGGVTLENVNNTIQGQGQIGVGHNMVFQNDSAGIVNANVSGQSLILNGTGAGINVINTGTLEATGGGILQIGNVVNNQNGIISTDSGNNSEVLLLQNSDIQGGKLNGNVKTVVNQAATLDGLTHGTLTNSGTITVVNGSTLTLATGSTINNTGTITLASTGTATQLLLGNTSGTTTLTGKGTITLSDSAHNNAASIFGNGVTLENVNNTIQGEGVLGGFQTTQVFKNDLAGIINANVLGRNLIIDGLVNNTGVMGASLGGILQLESTVNNSGGMIITDGLPGSKVQLLSGSTVQGGTLNGNVQTVAGNTGVLDGITHGPLTNSATVTVVDASQLNLVIGSTIGNAGTIALNSTGDATQIFLGNVSGTTTLTGKGTVTLSNTAHNGNALIFGGGGATLDNVDNTIQGEGQIGALTNIILKNDAAGTVNANVSGQALILNGTGGVINAGSLEATAGGILEIKNTVNNAGGVISTDLGFGSVVQLYNGAKIQGGFLVGNTQTVAGNTTPVLDGITHGPLTNVGLVTVVNNSQLTLAVGSTLINAGAIALTGQGNNTWLYLGSGSGTTTLTGGGTVILSNTAHNGSTLIYGDGGVTLDNVNNTIQGEGEIGNTHQMNLTNETGGTLLANISGQTLLIDPNGTFTNKGTMQVNAGSTLRVSSPTTLSATTFSAPTSTLLTGTYVVNSGKLQIDGFGNTAAGEIKTIGANASVTLNGANASTSFVDLGGNAALKPLAQISGSLALAGGYNFASAGTLNNSGAVAIGAGSSITTGTHDYTQNGGITSVNGTLTGTNVNITAGTLTGTGTVFGNAVIGSGAVLTGNLTFDPLVLNGTLQENLTSAGFGVTTVTGTVALNSGTSVLDILQAGNYDPAAGTALIIMTAGSPISGSFGTIENQFFNNGTEMWNVLYNPGGTDEVELIAANVTAIPVTATSNLSGPGHWTNPASWGCACVPNNNASNVYAVILNSPGQTLTLDAGDTPASITVNSADLKAGTLDLQTGGSLKTFGDFTVESGATLSMTGGVLSVGGMLNNQLGGLITGNGTISGGTLFSAGLGGGSGAVIADGGTLDLSGMVITNLNLANGTLTGGTWQAGGASAGTLVLPGDIVTNSAGIFLQNFGSQILDAGSHDALATLTGNQGGFFTLFSGATYTTGAGFLNNNSSVLNASFGGSALTISGNLTNSNSSLVNVNGNFGGASVSVHGSLSNGNTSTVQVQNGGMLNVGGNVSNSGQFLTGNETLDTGGNNVVVLGTFTNNLGGVLNLMASGDVATFGALVNAGSVTVGTGATINDSLTNSGTIAVSGTQNVNDNLANNSPGSITVNSGGQLNLIVAANTNATNSGTINLSAGTFSLADAGAGDTVTFSGGGTFNLAGGTITSPTTDMTFSNVDNTITGHGTISNLAVINGASGTITPAGTITMNTIGGLANAGTVSVTSGNVLIVNGVTNTGGVTVGSGGTLTDSVVYSQNGGSTTVGGKLSALGYAQSAGTTTVQSGGQLNVTNTYTQTAGGTNVTGTLSARDYTTAGDTTVFSGGHVNITNNYQQSAGTTLVQSGGNLGVGAAYTQTGGATIIQMGGTTSASTFMVNGGNAQVDGSLTAAVTVNSPGTLAGGGTITGNLTNNGTVTPGSTGTPGALTVTGDYSGIGTLLEQISSNTSFGQMQVGGAANLDGTLDISLAGYTFNLGDTFDILNAASVSGPFAQVDVTGETVPNGDYFDVVYSANSVELCVSDSSTSCTTGGGGPPPPVPEPASIVLLATAIGVCGWRIRRNHRTIL